MNKKPSSKSIFVILVVLILAWVVISQLSKGPAPVNQNLTASSTGLNQSSTTTNQINPSVLNKTGSTLQLKINAVFTSPLAGKEWIFNNPHTVSWTKSVGVTGAAYLLSAATGNIVGCILSTVQPNQTSFSWDTQYLSESCVNPTRINVTPGNYVIKIQFGKNQGSIQSGDFKIIYPIQAQTTNYSVSINNLAFNQSNLIVVQGSKIAITNNDNLTHQLSLSGLNQNYTLAPGQTMTFDTSVMTPGYSYSFYSSVYTSLRLTVTVKAAQN